MKLWIRLGCFLTGWNYNILTNCSEASFKQLKKYASALVILIILWAFTGFSFADRYIGTPFWGSVIVSIIFVVIIIQIERQIILTVGANWWSGGFRLFIAIIMALLGSAIIDQIIFKNDIDKKMIEIVDRTVNEQLPNRLHVIDSRLGVLKAEIDSLDKATIRLHEEISIQPNIKTVSTSTTVTKVLQDDGTYIDVPQTTTNVDNAPNPKVDQVRVNQENLTLLRNRQEEYTKDKLTAESNLRDELKSNSGFLEELNAIIEIISESTVAFIFYIIIFCFLISLELFIVTSKLGDKKCDYDLVVEHQLQTRINSLKELAKK